MTVQGLIAAELDRSFPTCSPSEVAARHGRPTPALAATVSQRAGSGLRKLAGAAAAAVAALLLTGPNLVAAAKPLAGSVRFLDHHGRLLNPVQLYLIHWGTAWTAATTNPTAEQITSAARTMLASSYLTGLAEYRGTGRGVLRGSTVITTSDPPAAFTDRQVEAFLDGQLDAGTVPGPDPDDQTLYGVLMPSGVRSGEAGFTGEHNYYTRRGRRIHFLWTAAPDNLDAASWILSHEVVEAATDPEGSGFGGVPGTCGQDGWCEIADICTASAVLDGVTVTSYWSNQAGRCVMPGRPPARPPGQQSRIGGTRATAGASRRPIVDPGRRVPPPRVNTAAEAQTGGAPRMPGPAAVTPWCACLFGIGCTVDPVGNRTMYTEGASYRTEASELPVQRATRRCYECGTD